MTTVAAAMAMMTMAVLVMNILSRRESIFANMAVLVPGTSKDDEEDEHCWRSF